MTAVDYLIKSLDLINWIEDDGQPHTQLKMLDDAQNLEKQQIIDAFEAGQQDTANGYYIKHGRVYYHEKYPNRQLKTDNSNIDDRSEAFDRVIDAMQMISNPDERLILHLAIKKYIELS